MGAQFGTECFAGAYQAALAECASASGVTSAGMLRCQSVGGTALQPTLNLQLTPTQGEATYIVTSPLYRECDPFEDYADLASLFGFAIPALLTIWLVKRFVLKLVMPQ